MIGYQLPVHWKKYFLNFNITKSQHDGKQIFFLQIWSLPNLSRLVEIIFNFMVNKSQHTGRNNFLSRQ
jgi:hypothetical protein